MTLFPCGACGIHVRDTEVGCPHCGATVSRSIRTASMLLLGLTLGSCLTIEDMYGVATSHPPEPQSQPTLADCSAFVFDGQTWDCRDFDSCDFSEENAEARVACCTCEPAYCSATDCDTGP